MKDSFRRLQAKDQLILVTAVVLLLSLALYYLVWQPLYQAQQEQRLQLASAQQTRDVVESYAQQIMALQSQENSTGTPVIENLTSHVNQSLQARQLSLTQVQQLTGDQLQIRLENADFAAVLAWIHDLESTPGLLLGEVSMRPAGTTQTGQVNITVGLSRLD